MRTTFRIVSLVLVLVALLIPFTAFASGGPCTSAGPCGGGGPCPDDPVLSKTCNPDTPPFYVVINRSFEDLTRTGSGCQPIILKHPDCTDCCGAGNACTQASQDVETRVCPILANRVDWTTTAAPVTVYEMCCNCATDPKGVWSYTVRELQPSGDCPVDPKMVCVPGLPPDTGIDLPAQFVVGGLAAFGAMLVGVGLVLRRRYPRSL
jgi:hypothetical protein